MGDGCVCIIDGRSASLLQWWRLKGESKAIKVRMVFEGYGVETGEGGGGGYSWHLQVLSDARFRAA